MIARTTKCVAALIITTTLILEASSITGGSGGKMVARPDVFGFSLESGRAIYYLALAVAVLAIIAALNLLRSRVGRAWGAIRDYDIAASLMGIHLQGYKLLAFAVSAFITGVAGSVLALHLRYLNIDSFALIASEVSYAETPLHAWKAMLAYSLQIYLDFSAYSDMAIGASRVVDIAVPENFNWPYLSRNIQEFWTRWHISLSSWARDYVFSPMGRELFKSPMRMSPTLIAALSYVTTFLVIGAWHGLTAGYLAWGLYHGLLVTGYYVYRANVPAAVARHRLFESRLADVAGAGVTFLLVTIGWVPFVVDTPHALPLLRLLLGGDR